MIRAHLRAAAAAFLAAALVLALGACAEDTAPTPEAPVPESSPAPTHVSSVLRLWRDLVPVEVSTRSPAQDGGELWFEAAFDGSQLFHSLDETREGVFRFAPFRPRGGQLKVAASQARAMAYGAPVRGGQAMSVRMRMSPGRPQTRVTEGAVAVLLELSEPFDPEQTLTREEIGKLLDPRRRASYVVKALLGSEAVDLRTDFVTDPSTVALVIYLLSPLNDPSQTHLFHSVSVHQVGLADHVAAGGAVHRVSRLKEAASSAAVAVMLDREERKALLAVPPASFAWDLLPSAGPRRLELSLGLRPRDANQKGGVEFRVQVDGVELLSEARRAPDSLEQPAWEDVLIDLPAGARRLVLSTEAAGDDPPLAFFGNPTLLTLGQDERPNVVLISLDTLRPDRLGCYGAAPSWSPHLDALAAEGLRYESAYSTSSYTLPSHGSMLTGQYPAFHGAVDVADALDPERSPALADLLGRAGWQTAAFTGGGFVSPSYGFGTGFDRYSDNDPVWATRTVRGQQLIGTMSWERTPIRAELLERYNGDAVQGWIEDHGDGPPFFLFLHTYIAHNYAPDQDWMAKLGLLGNDTDPAYEQPFNHKQRGAFNAGELALKQTVYEQYMPYYDATVGMADEFVGGVLAALERAGVADNTLVVVTSDHGEEFGEHSQFGHGLSLTEEVTRVPLIARLPAALRGAAGRVETQAVSLVDVAPWILSVVGVEADPRMAIAPPLGPQRSSPPGRDTLVLELDNHRLRTSAVRDHDLKLVLELAREGEVLTQEQVRLYDLSQPEAEHSDLAAARPEDVARLRSILDGFHELAQAVRPRDGEPVDFSSLDPDLRQQLEALGYLQRRDDDEQ